MLFNIYRIIFYILIPYHLAIILFFFIKNSKLFKNHIIYPFFINSFGHQVMGYDIASRLYYPKVISLIEIHDPRNNKYLSECYTNLDKFQLNLDNTLWPLFTYGKFVKTSYKNLIYTLLKTINLFKIKKIFLLEHLKLYKWHSANKIPLNHYENISDEIKEYNGLTGFTKIINSKIGKKPELPKKYLKLVSKELIKIDKSFFKKKTYTILFRKNRTNEYYDKMRNGGDEKKYLKIINKLNKLKHNVVLTGDFSKKFLIGKQFINIKNKLQFSKIPSEILNLYFLMYSDYVITQHSGASLISNAHGKPLSILVDAFPFFVGTHLRKDRLLYKNIFYKKKIINIKSVYENKKHRLLSLGKCKKEDGYIIRENTGDQIYKAVFSPKFTKIKFDKDIMIHYTKSKILNIPYKNNEKSINK